jgi:hypothetical protein
MNKYHKDDTINLAYEILNKHVPNINEPRQTHDESIEFNVIEAMMEFLKTMQEHNK